jgi:hypothetical protein
LGIKAKSAQLSQDGEALEASCSFSRNLDAAFSHPASLRNTANDTWIQ